MSETLERTLADQVAIVTGASRGIGRAIAERLASRGAKVACVATAADRCAETVAACGDDARAFGVDVSDTDAVKALLDEVASEMGPLNLLVNNAGITKDQLLLRMSEEEFDRVIEVNLKGAWNFIRHAARPLMKCKGRIINIASVVGITGNVGQANYAASKAGLLGLTRSVAKELAPRSVCVNAIAPGFIETDMTAGIEDAAATQLLSSIPLKRVGKPEEVALAVDYLAGPGGAYITGQTLVLDGGLSL